MNYEVMNLEHPMIILHSNTISTSECKMYSCYKVRLPCEM